MFYLCVNKYLAKTDVCRIFLPTSNSPGSLFPKKNSIIWILCKFGWLTFPISPVKWSSLSLSLQKAKAHHRVTKQPIALT